MHDQRPRVTSICIDPDFSDVRLDEIRKATEEELQCFIRTSLKDGLKKKHMVEDSVRHFYNLRETLSVYNEIVVKCKALYTEIHTS